MKQAMVVIAFFVCVLVGYVVYQLSSDTLAFAMGVLFGAFAGVPMALLMVAMNKQKSERNSNPPQQPIMFMGGPSYPTIDSTPTRISPPRLAERNVTNDYVEW